MRKTSAVTLATAFAVAFAAWVSGGTVHAADEKFITIGTGGQTVIQVTLADGRRYDAHLVKTLVSQDIAVLKIDGDDFPGDITPASGQIIEFTTPSGDAAIGTVLSVADDEVEVDFNHPLAGHTIAFDVEILRTDPPPG